MNLPAPKTMTIKATLKKEFDLKEFFDNLPLNEETMHIKSCSLILPEGLSKMEKLLLISLNVAAEKYFNKCLVLSIRSRSVKFYEDGVMITGCKSLEEASQIFEVLNLEVENINVRLVVYMFDMPCQMNYLDLIREFSESPDFITVQDGNTCILKYKKTTLRIQNNKMILTSNCQENAQEAYNEFMK